MKDSMLALDVMTNTATRAREVRIARDRYLDGDGSPPGVRALIVESWRRSAARGLDPQQRAAPLDQTQEAAATMLAEHPLGRFAPLLRDSLGAVSTASDHLVALTDADGLVLFVEGSPHVRREAAARLAMVPGARFSEEAAGTNAIGTSIAVGAPLQVFAAEHFCEHSQWWTCSAAPIRDWRTGRVVGTINLTAPMETVHPHNLALVSATAALIEASMRLAGDPGGAPLRAPAWPATVPPPVSGSPLPVLEVASLGVDRAAVRLDGRPVHLSLRHSELLVLLAVNGKGMSADQLALRLYGDEGKPVSARAEVSRLRRILPGCIETDPYRLVATVRTDFGELQDTLRAGDTRAAMQRYRGPLLPRSDAPGIAEVRDELDGWARRAAMASDDVETLWGWLASPSGDEDLAAWKRFLANLPPTDGRRGLAAARLERLRPLLTATRA